MANEYATSKTCPFCFQMVGHPQAMKNGRLVTNRGFVINGYAYISWQRHQFSTKHCFVCCSTLRGGMLERFCPWAIMVLLKTDHNNPLFIILHSPLFSIFLGLCFWYPKHRLSIPIIFIWSTGRRIHTHFSLLIHSSSWLSHMTHHLPEIFFPHIVLLISYHICYYYWPICLFLGVHNLWCKCVTKSRTNDDVLAWRSLTCPLSLSSVYRIDPGVPL